MGRRTKIVRAYGRLRVCVASGRFAGPNCDDGNEPWVSDGTQEGTYLLKDINPAGDSNPGGFTRFSGLIYFAANDGTHGVELWRTDGTEAGTVMVYDLNPGPAHGYPSDWTELRGPFVFAADDGVSGRELKR